MITNEGKDKLKTVNMKKDTKKKTKETVNKKDVTNEENLNELLQIHFDSFEEAKNHLKRFSKNSTNNFEFDAVPSAGGLFGLGDHKVTGDELNDVTSKIQNYLQNMNGLNKSMVKEFGKVYDALESLDSEYVPTILKAIEGAKDASISAQKASDHALFAQKEINKAHEKQSKIIDVLEKHRIRLDELKHLDCIDEIWDNVESLRCDFGVIEKEKRRLENQIKKLEERVGQDEKKNDELKHEQEKMKKIIEDKKKVIEELDKYRVKLLELKHLEQIDEIWNSVELLKNEYDNLDGRVLSTEQQIKEINNMVEVAEYEIKKVVSEIKIIEEYKSFIEQKNYDNQLAELRDSTSRIDERYAVCRDDIKKNEMLIKNINELINKNNEEYNDRINKFSSKIVQLRILTGTALVMGVAELLFIIINMF